MRRGGRQFFAHRRNLFLKRAVVSREGGLCGLFSLRADDLHDGLRFGQSHLTIQEGAARKFTRPGWNGARFEDGFQKAARHINSAVTRQLDDVFTGKAGGSAKIQRDRFVDVAVPVAHPAVKRSVSAHSVQLLAVRRNKYTVGDVLRIRA